MYCSKCGNEIMDEAVICPKCGCATGYKAHLTNVRQRSRGLIVATKVFMILGTIIAALSLYLIPLLWCIPMTVAYFSMTKNEEHIGVGFKVCCLLFVSVIGGILMLCDNN